LDTFKSRILLLVAPNRTDIYQFFKEDLRNDYDILYFDTAESRSKQSKSTASFIRKEYYWNDYSRPETLIRDIRPDKIVFAEIYDLKQIALCVFANKHSIETFFLDHGALGNLKGTKQRHHSIVKSILASKLKKVFRSLPRIVRNRYFYYSVIGCVSPKSIIKFIFLPLYMLIRSSFYGLHEVVFPERLAKKNIIFSRRNYLQYQFLYHFKEEQTRITGVPYFDSLFNPGLETAQDLVFIDTPFLEVGLFGWTSEHHFKIASILKQISQKYHIKVHVQLHPLSDKKVWEGYQLGESVQIHQLADMTQHYLNAKLILGFPSSMLIGLLSAKKNLVLLGWNPEPKIIGDDLLTFGICHASLRMEDAEKNMDFWMRENLCVSNSAGYQEFLKEYNYPFDGKAGLRIIQFVSGQS
jgi:hypothetical protein